MWHFVVVRIGVVGIGLDNLKKNWERMFAPWFNIKSKGEWTQQQQKHRHIFSKWHFCRYTTTRFVIIAPLTWECVCVIVSEWVNECVCVWSFTIKSNSVLWIWQITGQKSMTSKWWHITKKFERNYYNEMRPKKYQSKWAEIRFQWKSHWC